MHPDHAGRTMFSIVILWAAGTVHGQWMPCEPGAAMIDVTRTEFTLSNAALQARWNLGKEWTSTLQDRWNKGPEIEIGEPFTLVLEGGRTTRASGMKRDGAPQAEAITGVAGSSCLAETLPGQAVRINFQDEATGLRVTWRAILRDGSNYLRQEITLQPTRADVNVKEVRLIDGVLQDAKVVGEVPGSPITTQGWFFGFEHPVSRSRVEAGKVECALSRKLPLRAGQATVYSSVIGLSPTDQMRRGFLRYIERERAHPYRTFLHYNSWYDLGFFEKFDEPGCVERIQTFGKELVQKRGVKIDSFLFDDGWDDTGTSWGFHAGFPNGFAGLKKAAEGVGGAPGVWFSPWGGYGKPREQRLETGRKSGYEIDEQGFALSGPKYYKLFREKTLMFVQKYSVNQFKLDGTGSPDKQCPGSAFDSDFEAAIQLIRDLRTAKPDLFINLTTGTWPSPFWVRHADSTWRGGYDHAFKGEGSNRQQWITYRDGDTYNGVVKKGPLYPLTSLMLHGLIYAKHANKLNGDPNGDFRDEVRSYFGSGTHLQEMYVTPSLLSDKNWDDIAEAATWSRKNAAVLVDTHWIGGDPLKLEIYGWAAWTPLKATLVLRNPAGKPQSFDVDVAKAFELPKSVTGTYVARSPWAEDRQKPAIEFEIGKARKIEMKPFEVLVLDAVVK